MQNGDFNFNSCLDSEFLASVYEGDMEHVQIIFEQFVSVIPAQMNEIDQLFIQGDVEQFRQKVHKLKPVFSFVGLTSLTAEAEIIEKKCSLIRSLNEVEDVYKIFKSNYTSSLSVVKEELLRIKNFN